MQNYTCPWLQDVVLDVQSERTPTVALWKMDGKGSGNNFQLGSSSLANHGG
jgi:hypothetical protein